TPPPASFASTVTSSWSPLTVVITSPGPNATVSGDQLEVTVEAKDAAYGGIRTRRCDDYRRRGSKPCCQVLCGLVGLFVFQFVINDVRLEEALEKLIEIINRVAYAPTYIP